MLVVLMREGIEEAYLELVLSIVGVVKDTVGCTDDEIFLTGVVDNDKAI